MLIGIITLLAFSIRMVAPIGTSFYNLQFCFFAAYVVFFYLGTLAGRSNMVENLTLQQGKKWLFIAFGIGLPIWFLTLFVGKTFEGKMIITGGFNAPSFLYAFWESFFCVTFIIALIGIAKAKFNYQNKTLRYLFENTFGVLCISRPRFDQPVPFYPSLFI